MKVLYEFQIANANGEWRMENGGGKTAKGIRNDFPTLCFT